MGLVNATDTEQAGANHATTTMNTLENRKGHIAMEGRELGLLRHARFLLTKLTITEPKLVYPTRHAVNTFCGEH